MTKGLILRQRGTTLIITMVFLLVISIIGLAGMDVTGLEERMAGNMRDRNMAFQSAEAALLEGENYLESLVILPAFDDSDGHYALRTDGEKNWDFIDWSSSSAVRSYTGNGFSELAAPSAYILEDLAAASSSDSLEVGVPVDKKRFYRVTSRAVGLTGSSEVMLQTVYKR
ncbi:PilX N-terminal domain-containing pilus assembly protein [Neptuniibacter sp. QD72_48]|uniref:pilus assembly PilX family protein n=1 Tax=unclassified Neptuniibacter TaxID=2630693 RepID=UPI0039F55F78